MSARKIGGCWNVLTPGIVASIGSTVALFCLLGARGFAAEPPLPAIENASWIWGDMQSDVAEFRTELTIEDEPTAAKVLITADNGYELYVNGELVGFDIGPEGNVWGSVEQWDIRDRLTSGRNAIGIRGICLGGSRGVIAAVRVERNGAEPLELLTNAQWKVTTEAEPAEYSRLDYTAGESWVAATVLGQMGMAPWGNLIYEGSRGGRRTGALPTRLTLGQPDESFVWPRAVAFVSDDCSIYKTLRSEAWGIEFRIDDWTRAYLMFDLPCPSKIGRKLCVIDPLRPGAEPRVLIDAGRGVIGSPSASYDGRSLYVAMAPEGTSFFHIYRVPRDGGPPQQLTNGPFHDIDPAELPDGRIVFASTRIGTFEEYHAAPSRALFVMQPDGSGIHAITHTPIFDNEPKVLADGRTSSDAPRWKRRFTPSARTARQGRRNSERMWEPSTARGCVCWATAAPRRCPMDEWPSSPSTGTSWPTRAAPRARFGRCPRVWAIWLPCLTDDCWSPCSTIKSTIGGPAYWQSSIRRTIVW